MKKLFAIILSATMLFGTVACDPATTTVKTDTPTTTQEVSETKTQPQEASKTIVGVSMPTQSLQRWNQDGANMKAALEAKGYIVDLQYADDAVAVQISQIENMITKGATILVIAAIDGEALTTVLQTAGEAKIKVIAYDRLIRNTEFVDYYATFDNFQVGAIQGQYIVDKLDLANSGPFNIEFFGGSPDDNNAFFFFDGAMSILTPFIENGKLINKSGQKTMDVCGVLGWKPDTAQDRMDNLISANYTKDRIDAVLSSNDSLAYGIASSLELAGYGTPEKPYPVLTGQDCDIANVKNMILGKQNMSVFKDTRMLADKVVEMIDSIVAGQEPEVNNTESYNNGVKVVPSYLLTPKYVDINNYEETLVKSGYYTAEALK